MQLQLRQDPFGTYASFALCVLVGGWPWFGAYSAAGKKSGYACAMVYSILSVIVSLLFAVQMADAPAEGIGWNVILCTLVLWLAYYFATRLKGEEGSAPRSF